MKAKLISTLFAGLLLVTPFVAVNAGDDDKHHGDDDGALKKAVAEATAAKKKAASVGGEWRDIGKFLKKAKKAAKKGKMKKAMKLAKKAKWQGEEGYKQAMAQKDVGLPAYLK
ncbi:MAG: SoxXA-binding protein [Gammaproteobacteria bacterium]|nr:SoxXA-binding protein [Gammaproteobacteria bacterium]